ncbi:hypothetical protein K492DRAFT_11249 [Lichtheimia hyalospora FSU 10163]|nr:hypothetical protein K492DRAFT_11249 [Lichtheimia hyalospora FSU 10163]
MHMLIQSMSFEFRIERGPIDETFIPTRTHQGISRQTSAFIAASRRPYRTYKQRLESAEMASRNHYRETGRPLFIDVHGSAWRAEELPNELQERLTHEDMMFLCIYSDNEDFI